MARLKSERIYEILKDEIMSGRLEPGSRLVPRALAARLQTSDLPVREALWMLHRDGLAEMKPFVGARVKVHQPREIQESLYVRGHLEGLATRLAAPHLDDAAFEEMEQILTSMQEAIEGADFQGYSQLNRAFHDAIFERCPNRSLHQLINTLSDTQASYRAIYRMSPSWLRTSYQEHRSLVELLRTGDVETASQVACDHKLHLADALVDTAVEPVEEPVHGDSDAMGGIG